jgi:2-polyprenyl-3-methyl-5-hydroxy-6-metoxy-1,4-benzoquinol methylase
MERAETRCVLCDSEGRALLYQQGNWSVYRCSQCGLGFLDPRPDKKERDDLYRSAYFQDQYDGGLEPGSREMKRRLSHEDHRVRFFRGVKKRGRLLDIGCGMGYFLLTCQNYGYHVEGFDVSDDAAAYVKGRLEIPVRTGNMESLPYESGSFDIITMWHFLEHTPDPRVYLKKTWQLLKAGGLLVVDVPNYAGTDARKTWEHWKGWQLPYHLYHFTEETLCKMLSQHGFQIFHKKDYLSEYVKESLEKNYLMRPFARLIARCYSGHSIAVVSRK